MSAGKSNREQMEELAAARAAAAEKPKPKAVQVNEAAKDFEKRWGEHVKKGGLRTVHHTTSNSSSPRSVFSPRSPS